MNSIDIVQPQTIAHRDQSNISRNFATEPLEIAVEAADFSWSEVLGIPADSDGSAARQAMLRLALLYHPDKGGRPDQMVRINAAYEHALRTASITEPDDH